MQDSRDDIIVTTDFKKLVSDIPNRWRSAKEAETASVILARFDDLKRARQNSCPFPSPRNALSEDEFAATLEKNNEGYDWEDFWDNSQNLALMKHHYIKGRPNIKAATSYSPIHAAISAFRKYRLGCILEAEKTEYDSIVKARQKSLDYLDNEQAIQETKVDTLEDAMTIGSGFEHITYMYKVREVKEIITDPSQAKKVILKIQNDESLSSQEKKKILKKLRAKIVRGKPIEQKVKHIDYNDVARIYVDPRELYWDNNARCIRGNSYEATDVIWQQYPSLEQFRAEYRFSDDPYIIKENIDWVVSSKKASEKVEKIQPFYKSSTSEDTASFVVDVKKYFNKQTDQYIILANDIIIRKGPIPYKHKELPFIQHQGIKIKGCLYGIGLPYLLEGIQSSDEATRNFYLMLLYQQLNPPILRNKLAFQGIIFNRLQSGKVYDVNGSVGSENIRWFEGNGSRLDFFQFKNMLDMEATKLSGINPLMSAQPKSGEPVRNNMMTMETSLDSIRAMIANWAIGEKEAIRQILICQDQYYPKYKKEDPDKEENEEKYVTIRLSGTKLIPTWNDSADQKKLIDMKEEKIEGDSDFELDPTYFTIGDKIKITIDISQFPLVSEALQINNLKDVVTNIMPLRANPMIRSDKVSNEMQKALIKAIKPQNLEEILEFYDDDDNSEECERRAETQSMALLNGEQVVGIPGENLRHLMVHYKVLLDLSNKTSNPKISMQDYNILRTAIDNITQHVKIDEMPKDEINAAAITPAQAPQPGMPMQQAVQQRSMPQQAPPQGGPQMTPEMMGGGMPQGIGPSMGGQLSPMGGGY